MLNKLIDKIKSVFSMHDEVKREVAIELDKIDLDDMKRTTNKASTDTTSTDTTSPGKQFLKKACTIVKLTIFAIMGICTIAIIMLFASI